MAEAESDGFWLFGYGSLIWKPPPHFDRRVPGYVNGYVRRFWQFRSALLSVPGTSSFVLNWTSICLLSSNTNENYVLDFAGHETEISSCNKKLIDMGARRGTKLFEVLFTRLNGPSEDHRGTPEAPGRVVTLIERSFWESLDDPYTLPEDRVWGTAYRIEASKVKEVKEYLDIREINGYSIQYAQFHPAESTLEPLRCMVYIGMPDNPQFMGVQEPQALAKHIVGSVGPSGENKEYLYMLEQALNELSKDSGDAHITDLALRMRKIEDEAGRGSGDQNARHAIDKERSKAGQTVVEQAETEKS